MVLDGHSTWALDRALVAYVLFVGRYPGCVRRVLTAPPVMGDAGGTGYAFESSGLPPRSHSTAARLRLRLYLAAEKASNGNLGVFHVQAMRANIRASQHMWRYDYTSDYIIGRVNASRMDPGLNLYRANSTQCSAAGGAGQHGAAAHSAERILGLNSSSILGILAAALLAWFCMRALRRRAARRRSDPGGYLKPIRTGAGKPHVKRLLSGPDEAVALTQPPSPYASRTLELDRRRVADV